MSALAEAQLDSDERRLLDEFVAELKRELGSHLRAVWLYGSRARATATEGSDVDILVIVDEDRAAWDKRVFDIAYRVERRHGRWLLLKVITYDLEWLANRRAIEAFFIQEVDRDKIILCGEPL
ncbi:MAG: nucleotidyltransferase domain-containing protein [Solirubrobacterales bacterium]